VAINASQCAGGTLANRARSYRRRLSPSAQVEGVESFAIRQRLSIAVHRYIATSQIFTAADAEQLGFAVGGEGENRIAGHRAHRDVGLVNIPKCDQASRNGGSGVVLLGLSYHLSQFSTYADEVLIATQVFHQICRFSWLTQTIYRAGGDRSCSAVPLRPL